jgi:hypothetical protein
VGQDFCKKKISKKIKINKLYRKKLKKIKKFQKKIQKNLKNFISKNPIAIYI